MTARRDSTEFTRQSTAAWRAQQGRTLPTLRRNPGEEVDAYSRALIALDEAGFRYPLDVYAPGVTVRLFQPNSAFAAHEDITISGWNMVIKARPDTYTVWVPTLEDIVGMIYGALGNGTEVILEQSFFAGGADPVFPVGPCVVTVVDVGHGVGQTFREAATAALVDVCRVVDERSNAQVAQ